MKSKQFLLYLFIFLSMGAWAQKKITGKVTDSGTLETLPGVNVLVKGDVNTGTVTDIEGRYTITVPNEKSVLTFSFIGFNCQEVVVGNTSVVNVQPKTRDLGL